MLNIMKVICKILFKRKGFLITTFLLPLVLILAMSGLYSGNSVYNIGVINNDKGEFGSVIEDRLEGSSVIRLTNLKDGDYTEDLIYHKYEMVVTIDESFTDELLNGDFSVVKYKVLNEGETTAVVKGIIEGESSALSSISQNVDVENEGIDKVIDTYKDSKPSFDEDSLVKNRLKVYDSLGLIFYVIFISSSFSCVFLLEDERLGTKDRTIMGKITERKYYAAHVLIYLLFAAIPAIEYYVICNIFDMEFGIENKIMLLVISLCISLLAVTFNVLVTSVVKNKGVFGLVTSCFTLPMFMLTGCFWPYDMMGEGLQRVGRVFPTRWLLNGYESMQKGAGVMDIIPDLGGVIMLSILFFAMAVYFTRSKRVLIKRTV